MTTCPGCNGPKTRRAELCGSCRRTASSIGVSVVKNVATPMSPFVPRTPKQNSVYHGRLREIALLRRPGIERAELWHEERKLKKWSLRRARLLVGREVASSTELSELEMERLCEWLGDRIDELKAGHKLRLR